MYFTNMNKNDLINFENKIADLFNSAKIRAPIHLHYGNEDQLIKIFKKIKSKDWVFSTWRSHYHCLLKGVPSDLLEKEILDGKSISLCFPEYNIYSSAIVGGSLPIAVGTAMSIKLNKFKNKVYCFIGDMTSESGIAYECIKYSVNHNLPIKFIIEDNNKSVCTDTKLVWNINELTYSKIFPGEYVEYYKYETKYPHAGAGKRVQF